MVHHINQVAMKATATPEPIEAALESRRNQGRSNPAIKSFIAEDLDGLSAHDDDPDLNAKIQQPHRRRNEPDPQIADVPTCAGSGVDD